MAPHVLASLCLLSVLAGCDSAGDGAGDSAKSEGEPAANPKPKAKPEEAPKRVELTPETTKARLEVADANLEMGETEANGLRLAKLRCAGVQRPLLGGMAIMGAIAQQKAAVDACAPKGDAAIATWTAEGGLKKVEVVGSGAGTTDACLQAALSKVASPFPATCATVLLVGEAAGADVAAKAMLGEFGE